MDSYYTTHNAAREDKYLKLKNFTVTCFRDT